MSQVAFSHDPDHVQSIPGSNKNSTGSTPDASMDHGEFYLESGTKKEMTILISGKGNDLEQPDEKFIGLRVHRCFYEGCVTPTPPVPPSSRPNATRLWSKLGDWNGMFLRFLESIVKRILHDVTLSVVFYETRDKNGNLIETRLKCYSCQMQA